MGQLGKLGVALLGVIERRGEQRLHALPPTVGHSRWHGDLGDGLRTDHAWIDVPVPDNRGRPVHQGGVTGWPGLCFLRLTWQHTRGSALLGWVKDDAEYIAHQIDVGG